MNQWIRPSSGTPDEVRLVHRKLAAHNRIERARDLVRSAQLDLERQAAAAERLEAGLEPEAVAFDPADVEVLERVHADLLETREAVRGSGRSRRAAAQRVVALELAERLILARLDCTSFEEYQARRDAAHTDGGPVIDLAYLEFAQEELARAQTELDAIEEGELLRSSAPPLPRRRDAGLPVRFSSWGSLPAPHRP